MGDLTGNPVYTTNSIITDSRGLYLVIPSPLHYPIAQLHNLYTDIAYVYTLMSDVTQTLTVALFFITRVI